MLATLPKIVIVVLLLVLRADVGEVSLSIVTGGSCERFEPSSVSSRSSSFGCASRTRSRPRYVVGCKLYLRQRETCLIGSMKDTRQGHGQT